MDLTKKTTLWHWGKEQAEAFKELKSHMCCSLVLTQSDFEKKILSLNRCIGIWCRCCTLTKGRKVTIAFKTSETNLTPYRLLFSHIHLNRKELQHLRMGIASYSGSKNCLNIWLFWKDELATNQKNSVK